ncbi:MAG: lipoprotein insertase outer membrane protein LolB [Gammaproteobacteria bacterium]|nr:lipoprotein insertase outer membrane protein LolB [Gammaproteobacteria bacterium]
MNWQYATGFNSMRAVLLITLLTLQQACSYLPRLSQKMPENWAQTVAQRQQISSWKVVGRLGIQTEHNGGSLDIFWRQNADVYKIRLVAAMGQGTTLITGNTHGVTLRTAEGVTYAESADELLASSLGINLPLSGMHDWLRAVPVADHPVQKQLWDKQGQLYKLVQDGWNIEMSDYRQVGEHSLPHAFYMNRDDQPELEIRLLIREWVLMDKEIT